MKQGLELLVAHFFFISPSSRLTKTEESRLSNSFRLKSSDTPIVPRRSYNVGSINDSRIRVNKCARRNGLKLLSANKAWSMRFNRAVQDCGRRLNQSRFRRTAEVSFLSSANSRKRASASREWLKVWKTTYYKAFHKSFHLSLADKRLIRSAVFNDR